MKKQYSSTTAFKTALEQRLKTLSRKSGVDLQKLRRRVAFDRMLVRLFKFFSKELLLKGGYAMELRLGEARATKDIDLALKMTRVGKTENQVQAVRQMLQDAVQSDTGDFFNFLIGESTMDLEAIPYGGFRFPVEAQLDNRRFVQFPVDIVISSLFINPIDLINSEDWLEFAGIETIPFPAISKEQQFAEKLHAYTRPRGNIENSRVKDLIDMALLVALGKLEESVLLSSIQKVFEHRATHPVPKGLTEPPPTWIGPFDRLKKETGLKQSMDESVAKIAQLINLPIFVWEEKITSNPSPSKCHFCQSVATTWISNLPKTNGSINEGELTSDFDCQQCGPYRVTKKFMTYNNATHNPNHWESWMRYLQKRSQADNIGRILISTLTSIPKERI